MLSLSQGFLKRFDDVAYPREDPSEVGAAIARLGLTPPTEFAEFYQLYRGPFWSPKLGIEISDLVQGGANSVVELTEFGRTKLGLQSRFIVLGDLATGATIHVLDACNNQVFVVDFEGGLEELIRGELPPRWPSFIEFLYDYFDEKDAPHR